MTDRDTQGSTSGFFGLWDLLAIIEEVAAWALSEEPIDREALRLRLGVFRPGELLSARDTLRIVLLTTAEVRALLEGASIFDEAHPVAWPPDPSRLVEETQRLIAAAEKLAFLPGSEPEEADGPGEAHHAIRRVLGFVAGSIALSDAQLDLNVAWLNEALATLGPPERRRLQNATDVVFWASVVLLVAAESESEARDEQPQSDGS